MDRTEERNLFLKTIGWKNADVSSLAGDASFRRYDRVCLNGNKAVLMDAPPEFEDTRPFYAVAKYLLECGLYSPKLYGHNFENGFLLLEDLGDNLFKIVLEENPDREYELYLNAVNELLKLNNRVIQSKLPYETEEYNLKYYNMDLLLTEVSLFCDWYYPALTGKRLSIEKRQEFLNLWKKILVNVSEAKDCLVLRDYHAENLIDLGQGKVGQLDFQDAVIGHSAYDLVSLLQDSRRDATKETEEKLLNYFVNKLDCNEQQFKEDYYVLGAQRATKIIGIFARLYLRDGKKQYLGLMPRIWGLLERCMEHSALSSLKIWMQDKVPDNRDIPLTAKELKPNKAMILAAGLGKRMLPLTEKKPKPLIEVAGRSMLDHSLNKLVASGIKKVVVNKHYHANQIDHYVENRKDKRPLIVLSDESDKLLDSGGGVKKALSAFGGDPFYVLNSDMIWTEKGLPALERLATHWNDQMDILMLLIKREEAHGHDGSGDFHMKKDGTLQWRGQSKYCDYLYSGIMIMRPECFSDTPDGAFSLREIFDKSEKNSRLFGIVHQGLWYHVGTPDAVIATEQNLKGI